MPKVSVIVPVYNVEKYIERCLESLVKQTLQDIEIIVVNDGSTDNSEVIIKEYEKKYSDKIKNYTKQNGGLSDARNFGMQFATGEYIAFLDSDDYADITLYEKMYNRAIEQNCDYVECNFIWKYDNKEKKDIGIKYTDKHQMLATARVVAWNKLIKKELIDKTRIQFPKGLRYEDVEFFYKLLPYIQNFGFVEDCLIYYVQRASSIANTQNERTGEIFKVLDNVIDYYKASGFYNEYKKELEYTYARILLCSSFLRMINVKDKHIRKELVNKTWENLNNRFPEWKRNQILNNENSLKNRYMRSINKNSLKVYSFILRIKNKL